MAKYDDYYKEWKKKSQPVIKNDERPNDFEEASKKIEKTSEELEKTNQNLEKKSIDIEKIFEGKKFSNTPNEKKQVSGDNKDSRFWKNSLEKIEFEKTPEKNSINKNEDEKVTSKIREKIFSNREEKKGDENNNVKKESFGFFEKAPVEKKESFFEKKQENVNEGLSRKNDGLSSSSDKKPAGCKVDLYKEFEDFKGKSQVGENKSFSDEVKENPDQKKSYENEKNYYEEDGSKEQKPPGDSKEFFEKNPSESIVEKNFENDYKKNMKALEELSSSKKDFPTKKIILIIAIILAIIILVIFFLLFF